MTLTLTRILRGAIDRLLIPADDPRVVFADPDETLLERIRVSRRQLGEVERRLAQRVEALARTIPAHREHARHALARGHADIARIALEERQTEMAECAALERQLRDVRDSARQLAVIEQRTMAHISACDVRRELATARLSTAEARAELDGLLACGGAVPSLDAALHLTEERASYLEARADAIEQLTMQYRSVTLGERPPDPQQAREIDAELAELSGEIGVTGEGKAGTVRNRPA